MNLARRLLSLKIKSDHLKMPRPCAVEFHAGGSCSDERETPRDKPVASQGVWLGLILKDHKPTVKFKRRRAWQEDLISYGFSDLVSRVLSEGSKERSALYTKGSYDERANQPFPFRP